jgi:two-component system nitrogen regulation response regulator NtrX
MAHDILIVDDEPDIRMLIDGILADEGYVTRAAGGSEAALAAFNTRRPSLVVLDVWLQGSRLDGIDLLEMFHGEEPQVPVVMISGHGTIEMAVGAIQHGATISLRNRFSPIVCCWWCAARWKPPPWRARTPNCGCAPAPIPD